MSVRIEPANPPHLRWNYSMHVLDGGLYMGSQALLSANSVLTTAIGVLGGPAWLIALMPSMMVLGVSGMPVLTAHRLDRLSRSMPLLLATGVCQRIPLLTIGLLLLWYPEYPVLLCVAVAVGHLFSGLCCGVGLPAWQELLSHTVPPRRRASVFANRYLIGSGMGLAGGWFVKRTLAEHPGAAGYGILHLWAFGILVLSYAFFAALRETPRKAPPAHTHLSLKANLRAMPGLVARYPQFGLYLVTSALANGALLLAPFLAIHCLRVLDKSLGYVGVFVVAEMAGGVCSNLLSGWLGDRHGSKLVLSISQLSLVVTVVVALLAHTPAACWTAFFGLGFVQGARKVGGGVLLLEIAPGERRSSALAVASLVQVASLLACSGLSAVLWHRGGLPSLGVVALVAAVLAWLGLARLRDPRHLDADPQAS